MSGLFGIPGEIKSETDAEKHLKFHGFVPAVVWRFIVDDKGVLHHVPGHETLQAMCDMYYGRWVP